VNEDVVGGGEEKEEICVDDVELSEVLKAVASSASSDAPYVCTQHRLRYQGAAKW
jgi:hypothetical protein